MDGEQAARWAAAQEGVPVGADLVAAALRRCGSWSSSRRWTAAGGSMRARCSTGPYAGTDDARNNFPLFYHFSSPLAFGCWRTQGTVHAFSRGRQLFIFVGPGS